MLVAQLCHIEAAEENGPRYNKDQSDEARRSFENLLFLCHAHHKITDDISIYTVEKLKEIKSNHEAMPLSALDAERLLEIFNRHDERLKRMQSLLEQNVPKEALDQAKGYKIITSDTEGPWLPDPGRFYKCIQKDGSTIRFMAKDEIICVEQTFPDGKIAYYEVDENGTVSENKFPYPIGEYKLSIPHDMIVRQEHQIVAVGTKVVYHLKWGRSVSCLRDRKGVLIELGLQARSRISHQDKLIEVLSVP